MEPQIKYNKGPSVVNNTDYFCCSMKVTLIQCCCWMIRCICGRHMSGNLKGPLGSLLTLWFSRVLYFLCFYTDPVVPGEIMQGICEQHAFLRTWVNWPLAILFSADVAVCAISSLFSCCSKSLWQLNCSPETAADWSEGRFLVAST